MRRFVVGLTLLSFAMLAPIPARAGDQEIAQQIVQKLKQHKEQGDFHGFSLDLKVEEGVVWLKGHVSDPQQEYLALDLARRVPGVVKVVDAIDVRGDETPVKPASTKTTAKPIDSPKPLRNSDAEAKPTVVARPIAQPATPIITDETIAESIINRLKQHKDSGKLRGFGVDVNVVDGDVWMKGHVASEEQRQLVLDVASHTRGVRQVINDLTVKTPQRPEPTKQAVVNAVAEKVQTASAKAPTPTPAPAPAMSVPPGYRLVPVQAVPVQQVNLQSVVGQAPQMQAVPVSQMPRPYAPATLVNHSSAQIGATPVPMHSPTAGGYGVAPARFDHPQMPGYAWPSYAAHPNYAAVTYPKQYGAQAWPYIGPFYPYPQVPLGWRKVELQWDDGWWFLDFKSK
ncbi:MAG: BON domain-containing protein [Pirellulaceae bacterium]|nr:BON domain-containing protein [Planctomycetales bacterium]MCA9203296.1 BON domain-containing protein [Planctomycetales bacterium]MCA9219424.1 BON domain-containing protein [Planctomycetales bacterium]MCA9225411.1 BON domain-containing protein [Planctomycetales bacterium]